MSNKDTLQLEIPKGADAAICFIHDQYYLRFIKDGAQMGKFLSPASVRQAFSSLPEDSGWIPEGVKRCGNGTRGKWMVAYHAPAIYPVLLDVGKNFHPRKLRVPMPALVWFGQGNSYYVWAMKGDKFDPEGELFHAPLANVNNIGLICFGKNAHPDVAKGGFEKTWQTFWDAPFNDDHSAGKSRSMPVGSINLALIELHKAKATAYPQKDLIAMDSTLEKAVEKMTVRDSDPFSDYE